MGSLFQTEQEQKAEEFIEQIRRIFAGRDDLIYEFDGEVQTRNVISPSTVGHRDAWIHVRLFNVSDPEKVFGRHMWMRFGEMGADIDTHEYGRESVIEVFKRFK